MQFVRTKGLALIAVIAMTITSIFLAPTSSGTADNHILGDLVVGGNDVRVIDRDVVIQGNVIVKDNATLVLSRAEVEVLQYAPNEYDIVVSGGASLILSSSRLFSDYALDVILTGSSKLQVADSHLDAGGVLSASGNGFTARGCEFTLASASILSGYDISDSAISASSMTLAAPGVVTNGTISGLVSVSSPDVRLLNTTVGSLQVSGSGEVRMYHWLYAKVRDMLGLPIDGANVQLKRYPTNEFVDERRTSGGVATFTPISDTITSLGPAYMGNYTLSSEYGGSNTSAAVVLPPFKPNRPTSPLTIGYLDLPVMATYQEGPGDLVVSGSERVIYGTGNTSVYLLGNIIVKNGGKLVLRNACKVVIDQSKGRAGLIVDSGTIEVREGSIIESDAPMGIYMMSGTLVADDARINASIGGSSAHIALNDTVVAGAVKGSFVDASMVKATVDSINVTSASIAISGMTVNQDANITSGNMSITDVNVKGVLSLAGSSLIKARSLQYGKLNLRNAMEVWRYWRIDLTVTNGNDRPVPEASINVYHLTSQGGVIASAKTDHSGRAVVDLLGDITKPGGTTFTGNYLIEASFTKSGTPRNKTVAMAARGDASLTIRFPEKVIPPFSISARARTDPAGDIGPGSSFFVRGEVYYNSGPDPVPGAQVTVLCLEDGKIKFNLTTNSQGIFSVEVTAPVVTGNYTIEIHVFDPVTGFTNVTTLKIMVQEASALVVYAPWIVIGAILVILVVFYAMMRVRRKYRVERMKEESRKLAFDDLLLKELKDEMDADEKVGKKASKAKKRMR